MGILAGWVEAVILQVLGELMVMVQLTMMLSGAETFYSLQLGVLKNFLKARCATVRGLISDLIQ